MTKNTKKTGTQIYPLLRTQVNYDVTLDQVPNMVDAGGRGGLGLPGYSGGVRILFFILPTKNFSLLHVLSGQCKSFYVFTIKFLVFHI